MDFKFNVTLQADTDELRHFHRNSFFVFTVSGVVILILSFFLSSYISGWTLKNYNMLPFMLINTLLWPFVFLWLSLGVAHGLEWFRPIRPLNEHWCRFIRITGFIGLAVYLVPCIFFWLAVLLNYFHILPEFFNTLYFQAFRFLEFTGKQAFFFIDVGLCLYFGQRKSKRGKFSSPFRRDNTINR